MHDFVFKKFKTLHKKVLNHDSMEYQSIIRFHNHWAADTAKLASIATPMLLGISVGTSVGTLLFTGSSITFTAAVLPVTSTALMTGGLATTVIAIAATTVGIGAVAIAAVGIGVLAVKGIALYIEKRQAQKFVAKLSFSDNLSPPSHYSVEQDDQQKNIEAAQQERAVAKSDSRAFRL